MRPSILDLFHHDNHYPDANLPYVRLDWGEDAAWVFDKTKRPLFLKRNWDGRVIDLPFLEWKEGEFFKAVEDLVGRILWAAKPRKLQCDPYAYFDTKYNDQDWGFAGIVSNLTHKGLPDEYLVPVPDPQWVGTIIGKGEKHFNIAIRPKALRPLDYPSNPPRKSMKETEPGQVSHVTFDTKSKVQEGLLHFLRNSLAIHAWRESQGVSSGAPSIFPKPDEHDLKISNLSFELVPDFSLIFPAARTMRLKCYVHPGKFKVDATVCWNDFRRHETVKVTVLDVAKETP